MQQLYVLIKATISEGQKIDLYGPFMDAGGYCYAEVQFEEEEAYISAFRQHAGTATECHADIIILELETNRICGFYPDGELFGSVQWDRRADRRYHARCETRKAIYLPEKLRLALPVSCSPDSFFFPPKSDYAALDYVMAKMTGGTEHDSLVLFPPNTELLKEACIGDFEALFSEYEKSSDCRLLPKLLCASQRAIETGEDEFASYCIAYALLHLAIPDMALKVLDPLLKIDPEYVDALMLRGICEMRLNQMAASIETLNQALSLQDDDGIRYYLGLAYDWYGYSSIAYRQFSSITDPYWKELVSDILLDMVRDIPYVTGFFSNSKLPAPYPIPRNYPNRSTIIKDFHGRSQYICFIRDKGIQATPEECVRQEFVQHLILDLGYPKPQVLVEESLSHMDRSLRERVDILVYFNEEKRRRILLMVECKALNVPLDGVVGEQALRYNQILSAKYIILTNGNETQVYRMDEHKKKYVACISIPTYKQLLSDSGVKEAAMVDAAWIRPDYASLFDPRKQQAYIDVHYGNGTDIAHRPAILNIAFLLRDSSHTLSCPFEASPFTIIEDKGLTEKAVGNPSGGRYPGAYRWFTVQDNRRHMFQVYMAVFSNYSSAIDLDYSVEGGKSTLLVAVDRRGQPISVLQIDLDKHLRASASGHELTHSGVRSRAKIDDLMPHIESQAPYLLGGKERITFGYLDTSKNLVMSDPQTAKVIANIISYSLIRFQLRETKPKKKVTTKR